MTTRVVVTINLRELADAATGEEEEAAVTDAATGHHVSIDKHPLPSAQSGNSKRSSISINSRNFAATSFQKKKICYGVVSWTNTTIFTIRYPPSHQRLLNVQRLKNFTLSLPWTTP